MAGRDVTGADGILAAAELWASEAGEPLLLAGWEDLSPGCGKRAAADGAEACRRCASGPVRDVLRTGKPAQGTCIDGTRLLAFPAPSGSRQTVALLRLGGRAAGIEGGAAPSGANGGANGGLRGANVGPSGHAVLAAARVLRDGSGLTRWQAEQRARGAERRRTAVAALEHMVATTEEFHRLYITADRDRASTAQDASNLDSLARETLRESEDARTDIAHNLHDTAAQSMVSAHRFLEAARASLAGPDPKAADRHLDAAGERLLGAIREIRGVLNSLVPPGLEELGLANALRIYIRGAVPETIRVEFAGDLPRAEGWLEAGLFAMTIGAIDNAVTHARPTLIEIALRADDRTGIISVRDDGVGFDPAQARRHTGTGMGLLQMGRRASWFGGRLDVTSRPGEGTTVRITVPLGEAPSAGSAGR